MPDLWSQFYRDYCDAEWGTRGAVLELYCGLTGRSRQTLIRKLKALGYETGRAARNGGERCLDEEQIQEIAAFIRTSKSRKGRMAMDTGTAMLAARHKGIIREGQAAEGTVRRLLAEKKVSKRHQLEPTPHVNMRSLHPNHVHQVDATPCVQYYLHDDGRVGIRDTDEEQLYKPEKMRKVKRHLIRYLLVDHFSGAFYVRYYYAAGENWHNLFDFLFSHAWREKPDWIREKYPFAHVPELLVWDAGSANQSAIIKRILDRLEVAHKPHLPGNPRGKGGVESMMWVWEQKFESLLRMEPATGLEDLNQKALDMCAFYNATKKLTRTEMTRMALWSIIKAENIRILPPLQVIQALAHSKPERRKVEGNLIVRYGGLSYDLHNIPGIARGEKIEITVNPYRHPDVTVMYEGKKYAATAIQYLPGIQGGFRADAVIWGEEHRAHRDTPAMKAGKEMDREATGAETQEEAQKALAAKKPVQLHGGLPFLGKLYEELEPISFIDRSSRAAEIPLTAQAEARDIPRLKAAKWIKEELGSAWAPWMAQALKADYGDTVPEHDIPAIIERFQSGQKTAYRATSEEA